MSAPSRTPDQSLPPHGGGLRKRTTSPTCTSTKRAVLVPCQRLPGYVKVQRSAVGEEDVLDIARGGIGGFAEDEDASVRVLEEGRDGVAAQVWADRNGVTAEVFEDRLGIRTHRMRG